MQLFTLLPIAMLALQVNGYKISHCKVRLFYKENFISQSPWILYGTPLPLPVAPSRTIEVETNKWCNPSAPDSLGKDYKMYGSTAWMTEEEAAEDNKRMGKPRFDLLNKGVVVM